MSFAEWVDVFRDIFISLFFLSGVVLMVALVVFSFLLFLATRAMIRTAARAVENVSKVSEAAVEHVVTPLEEGASFTSVIGNAFGFVTGFIAGLRGRKPKGGDKGKQ